MISPLQDRTAVKRGPRISRLGLFNWVFCWVINAAAIWRGGSVFSPDCCDVYLSRYHKHEAFFAYVTESLALWPKRREEITACFLRSMTTISPLPPSLILFLKLCSENKDQNYTSWSHCPVNTHEQMLKLYREVLQHISVSMSMEILYIYGYAFELLNRVL